MQGVGQSLILRALVLVAVAATAATANFLNEVDVTWGDGRGKILANGDLLQLTMDKGSGSGFQSKQQYLFGRLDVQMKLIPGNSAGTVTTFYLSSQGPAHDEIDFEFLGNSTGDPYVLHTNVFSQGKGGREQQFFLWFDPRTDFHTYTIIWNPENIIFYVDGSPIRVFKNNEASLGVPYLKNQAMRVYASLWDGENWATKGGQVKTDWSKAPFVASYRGYVANACFAGGSCSTSSPWYKQGLDAAGVQKLNWVRNNYMIYDYCRDVRRFPQGLPPECSK